MPSITPNYTNLNPVCDSNVCNLFSCLTSEGAVASNSTDCGVCCCNPNSSNDQCTQISSSLTCLPNKGLCTGSKRGLCCGCSTDASCVNLVYRLSLLVVVSILVVELDLK